MFQILQELEDSDKFIYIVIIIIFALLGRRYTVSPATLLGIIVGIIVVAYNITDHADKKDTFLGRMDTLLKSKFLRPHVNTSLAHDSELLIFLDNHREYKGYNPAVYNSLVRAINSFNKLSYDITLGSNGNLDYDVLVSFKKKIMNIYHSFIHTVPHTDITLDKYHKGYAVLEAHLNKVLDNARQLVVHRNSKEITTDTKFYYANQIPGHDASHNPHYHFI